MGAESLEEVEVSWHGLAGDRRYAFVRDGLERSGFPYLTIRERSDMAHYRPSFSKPDRPDRSPTLVRTPGGRELDVLDPALVEDLGGGARSSSSTAACSTVEPGRLAVGDQVMLEP